MQLFSGGRSGDSILVDLGETEILIDGGDRSPGVVSYLKKYVDGALEIMIATHPHADHIGGLIDVLATFEVKQIWHNGENSMSKTYSDFMFAVNSENAKVSVATRGNVIEADSQGNVSWSWKVGTRITPGSWRIVVTASLDGETISQTTYFTVY